MPGAHQTARIFQIHVQRLELLVPGAHMQINKKILFSSLALRTNKLHPALLIGVSVISVRLFSATKWLEEEESQIVFGGLG